MSEQTIITHYASHPSSNVGRVVARLSGSSAGTRSVRMDQALSSVENHTRAAVKLAGALGLVLVGEPVARERGGYSFTVRGEL